MRDLGPGDGAHSAEEGTHQNATETDEHTDAEFKTGKPAGDQTHPIDLCHHIRERAQDRGEYANTAHNISAVSFTEEIRNGELAKLPQVRCQQERNQAVAARPAHHKGEPIEAGQVQHSGHADKRRSTHPIRARGHAIEERRYPPTCDVILCRVHGTGHDADRCIERDRGEQKPVTDPLA